MSRVAAPLVLMTDFGLEGPYVGQMKGVLAERAPGHPVIDLTHAVSPQDVREGAFLLEVSWRYFPPDSVFIAVVDPGVGTSRAPLAVFYKGRYFVGPDNGLLTGALPDDLPAHGHAVRIENPCFRLPDLSSTFHGRDLFAPAGAALASGTPLHDLGPPADSLIPLPHRDPHVSESAIQGRIVHIDRFGNLVSNISRALWDRYVSTAPQAPFSIHLGEWFASALHRTYADVPSGKPLALFGSMGYLEVGVSGGHAAESLQAHRGDLLTVRFG